MKVCGFYAQAHPEEIHLLLAVVKYKTKMFTPRQGVCSTWLAGLAIDGNTCVPVWVKPGTIEFPSDPSIPVIMVGPGM